MAIATVRALGPGMQIDVNDNKHWLWDRDGWRVTKVRYKISKITVNVVGDEGLVGSEITAVLRRLPPSRTA